MYISRYFHVIRQYIINVSVYNYPQMTLEWLTISILYSKSIKKLQESHVGHNFKNTE